MADHLKPNRKKLTIMSALATGWLPWGVAWPYGVSRSGQGYALCCGHKLSAAAAAAFIAAGLLKAQADEPRKLEITDAGREWLARNWR